MDVWDLGIIVGTVRPDLRFYAFTSGRQATASFTPANFFVMTPARVADQRCLRHTSREAVARCPQCRYFFCRECIAEHDDRVLCADCLAKMLLPSEKRGSAVGQVVSVAFGLVGIAIAWGFFNIMGQLLARAPASFHEGSVWEKVLPDQ
jgi:hypothetical protein